MDDTRVQDEMALAIGQMTMAWSRAHFQMFDLLRFVTSHQDHPTIAEFFAYPNDEHKRKTVRKVFVDRLGAEDPLTARLKLALKKADELSLKRNAFIHTPLWEIEGVEGIQPQEEWGSRNHRSYIIKSNALEDCREIHREIEEIETAIYDLIDDTIVTMMFQSTPEAEAGQKSQYEVRIAQATRLAEIARNDSDLMTVLTTVRGLGLNDWLVFSGSVYQAVWNNLTGRVPGYGVKDFDLGYFDEDVSWDAEDAVIKRVAAAFDEPLRSRVEVRNQRRVSEWFEAKFGEPYPPIKDTAEALTRFVAPAFAVGVRLEDNDQITVVAPFGLDDVFDMRIRPNPHRPVAKDWERITAKALERWPELTVIEP